MKYSLTAAAALFATTVVANKRDLCSDGSEDVGGNWYCQAVEAITYIGVGGDGTYNRVTNMDGSDGTCSSSPHGYSGNLSPLDEEVSLHFRGPVKLKQFAVYTPSGSSSKKGRRAAHERRHAHAHAHGHQHHAREAAVGDMVTATIDGVVVSWTNEWSGLATSAPAADSASPAPAATTSTSVDGNQNWAHPWSSSSSTTSSAPAASSSSSNSGSISSSSGGWGRQAYYDSSSGSAKGLVFLNHNGGSGSGVFDYTFGNSLSYASCDGTAGASSAQTLEDTTLPSTAEVVIMSDSECGDNGGDCGYYRPDTTAYHGFDGPQKAFFFEFQMPDDGTSATNQWDPANMPAIWMLNAQIPRTLQYGNGDCSCWKSGCGEFDIFEVLAPGDARMKSTLHGNVAGGDSDYFDRPFDKTIKAALVLYDNNIHIKLLDDDQDFGDAMSTDTIEDICGSTLEQTKTISLFALSG